MKTVVEQLEAYEQDLLDNPPSGGDIDVYHDDPEAYIEEEYSSSLYDALRPIRPTGAMERKIAELKKARKELKEQIRNIEQYDTEDVYEDGTVLSWTYGFFGDHGQSHYNAAIRDNGEWYITGSLRGLTWEQLVVDHLSRAKDNGRVSMLPPPKRIEV